MGIPEDPTRFFNDLLFRQDLVVSDSSCSSVSSFQNPIDLLSRDQLITLWQSCASDEPPSSRSSKAVKLFLRDKALLSISRLNFPVDVPALPVLRPLTVKQSLDFAAMTRHDLLHLILTS